MTISESPAVVIVGAGVAGLCCARRLAADGVATVVLEAADDVGGRVRTDCVETPDGTYLLDRGFQVYLTAYPEGRRVLRYGALGLGAFPSGALVRFGERFWPVADPLRRPLAIPAMLRSPVASLGDLVRLGLLDLRWRTASLDRVWSAPEQTSLAMLEASGLSHAVIDRFFRPFFGGVFLDRSLKTSARMLRFTYRMFSRGRAALPAAGMQAIPDQLRRELPEGTVRLRCAVERVEPERVILASGETLAASAVIVATDGTTASRLVPGVPEPAWRATTTIYFAADRPPVRDAALLLDGDGTGPANHVAVLSNAQPSYAPAGKALVCANVIDDTTVNGDDAANVAAVRAQMTSWFGADVETWTHLRTDRIPHALPRQDAPALAEPRRPVETDSGVLVCGDHVENASINAAMASGRRAAEAVLRRLRDAS